MATPIETVLCAFYRKLEQDEGFFQYFNLTDEEAAELAKERAEGYMAEACARIALFCKPDISFSHHADAFEADLTRTEIDMLASLMFEMYLEKDIAKLRVLDVNYTPNDLQVFSPSQSRKTFMEMYENVRAENRRLLDGYKSRDRLTGDLLTIDYAAFAEE